MEWYQRWFGEDYLLVYEHRDTAEAELDVAAVVDVLGLEAGDRVLDLCCGSGRHDFPFAERGLRIVGLDYSAELLAVANESRTGGRYPQFVRGDARKLPFAGGAFDAVVNLFTSFGYFCDEENCGLICSMAAMLRRGGGFYIDYLNPSRVLETLVPCTTREINGVAIEERRQYDSDSRRVEKCIRLERDGESKEYTESVRLYSPDEMKAILSDADLECRGIFGSPGREQYDELRSPRMILFGIKP